MIEITLTIIIIILLAIIVSSLPLYFSVRLFGGDASILKVFFTNILVAIISSVLLRLFGFGALIILLSTILVYMFMFKLGFFRAFFAWLIQYVVAFLLVLLFLFVLGLSLLI